MEVLRGFLVGDGSGAFDVDLARFDADDEYKERVFYGINPLVVVERCPRIARMLADRRERRRQSDLTLRQFMTVLGLRTVGEEAPAKRYKTRGSLPHHDKENAAKGREPARCPKRPAKVLREDNAPAQRDAHPKRAKSSPQKVTVSNHVVELSSEDEFLAPKAPVRLLSIE